jgi:hypothetical protein
LRDLAVPKIGAAIHNYICQTGDPIKGTSDVLRLTPRERDADFSGRQSRRTRQPSHCLMCASSAMRARGLDGFSVSGFPPSDLLAVGWHREPRDERRSWRSGGIFAVRDSLSGEEAC